MARGEKFRQEVVYELEDRASAPLKKIQGRFSSIGSFLASKFVFTLGDVTRLLGSMADGVRAVVAAAQEQEDAVKRLDSSLSALGPRAAEVSTALQDQAAALEATTKFSDEAIIANQALAINLGVTATDAGKLTQAAVELSSATGRSLESSFVNLARTLNGFRGELGELIPEVAHFSEEQLRAGAALEVVLDRLGGTAASEVQTFSGAITQLGNAWGSTLENLGASVTQNEKVTGAIRKLRDTITSEKFQGSLALFADGMGAIASKTGEAAQAMAGAVSFVSDLGVVLKDTAAAINEFFGPLNDVVRKIDEFRRSILRIPFESFKKKIRDAAEESRKAADAQGELADNTERGADAAAKAGTAYEDTLRKLSGLREEQDTTADATKEHTEAVVAGTVAIQENYAPEVVALTEKLRELEVGYARTTEQAQRLNVETGGALSGVTARSKRQQADVDAAIAAGIRPHSSTRIKTVDGGSRLIN